MQLREQGASSAAADRLLHWARHDALVASTAYPRQVEIEVTLLSWIGLAALPTAALLNACILLLIGRWLMRAPWGEDVSWSDGAWRPTDQIGRAHV